MAIKSRAAQVPDHLLVTPARTSHNVPHRGRACLLALPSVVHSLVCVVSELCSLAQRAAQSHKTCRTRSARSLGSAAAKPPENRREGGLRNSQMHCGNAIWVRTELPGSAVQAVVATSGSR